jgi:hypothetical protein
MRASYDISNLREIGRVHFRDIAEAVQKGARGVSGRDDTGSTFVDDGPIVMLDPFSAFAIGINMFGDSQAMWQETCEAFEGVLKDAAERIDDAADALIGIANRYAAIEDAGSQSLSESVFDMHEAGEQWGATHGQH